MAFTLNIAPVSLKFKSGNSGRLSHNRMMCVVIVSRRIERDGVTGEETSVTAPHRLP